MPIHLTQTIQYMMEQNIRSQTYKNYSSANNHYIKFCNRYSLPLYPITQEQYMYYIADSLYNVGAGTIKTYMCGINYNARISGFPVDVKSMPHLLQCKKALTTVFDANKHQQREPYLWKYFEADVTSAGLLDYDSVVKFAALCGGMITMMRPSEYLAKNQSVHFDKSDDASIRALYIKNLRIVQDTQGSMHHCLLKCLLVKTDKSLLTVEIVWPKGRWPLSPADWIMKMLQMRRQLATTNKKLEILPKSYVFTLENGKVLTLFEMKKFFVKLIEKRGFEVTKYPLYAIKDGGVTSLARHGATQPQLKQL